MKNYNSFPARLRHAMDLRGISATQLAHSTGMSRSSMSQYLSGAKLPGFEAISSIVTTLNISSDWLILGRGQIDPPTEQINYEAINIAITEMISFAIKNNVDNSKLPFVFNLFYRQALNNGCIDQFFIESLEALSL